MKKIALLDDELISRNKISTILQNLPQFEIVLSTANPYELLNYLEIYSVDLIFLDMNMPIMNGLAFLEQLELIDRTTKVIVMSGYADFNYASGSMKYGVVDYLLKHELSEEVISEALKKINFFTDEPMAAPAYETPSLRDFFHGNTSFLMQQYPHFVTEKMVGLVMIPISISKNVWDKEKYKRKVSAVLEQLILDTKNETIEMLSFVTDDGKLFMLYSFAKIKSYKAINDYLETIKNKCYHAAKRLLDVELFLLRSPVSNQLSEVLELFKSDERISDLLFFSRPNELLHFSSQECSKNVFQQHEIALYLKKIYFYTKYIEPENIEYYSKKLFEYIREKRVARSLALELIAQIDFQISLAMSNSFRQPMETMIQINYYQQFDTLLRIEADFFEAISLSVKNFQKEVFKPVDEPVKKCILYLHQHFKEPISLQTCAEAIDLNYSYLSRVFKQQWGQSFSKYLSELRIDYAKLLLSTSSCSVNEVARQSGFANYNYFFRVFKERVGISPYQFNRNIMDYE